jgi:hypothetical protein
LIGFDLHRPGFFLRRYQPQHFCLVFGYIEFHFLFGVARDFQLDVLEAGLELMKSERAK